MKGWLPFGKLPPAFAESLALQPNAFWFDSRFNYLHQIWPLPSLGLTHGFEIDSKPMRTMGRIGIDLGTSNVRKDPLGVPWVFANKPMHLTNRRSDSALVCIVEGETHPQNVVPDIARV